ncbi:MAG TPA: YceH family protein [Terrimicrobiaceae bacterium]
MALFALTPVETRILGCLLEKERITPENYPLSINSLIAACNQSTNRDPVVSYDEKTVEAGLDSLREKKLATMTLGAGSRVPKYRHNLLDHFELNQREVALLCVLLLRGPQTLGELRLRTERLQFFDSLEQVESFLSDMGKDDNPLVRILPARPGQKEKRYVQLVSGEPVLPDHLESEVSALVPTEERSQDQSRIKELENEIAAMKTELQQLRQELLSFRKQFE